MHSSLLVRDRHFNWLELINSEAQASLRRFPNNPIVLWMRLLSALKPQKQRLFNHCLYDLLFWRTLWSLSWKEILVTYFTLVHTWTYQLKCRWYDCARPMICGSQGFWPIWEKTRRGQICHWGLISVLVLREGMLHSVSDCSSSPTLYVTQQQRKSTRPSVRYQWAAVRLLSFYLASHKTLCKITSKNWSTTWSCFDPPRLTRGRDLCSGGSARSNLFMHSCSSTQTHTCEYTACARRAKQEL